MARPDHYVPVQLFFVGEGAAIKNEKGNIT